MRANLLVGLCCVIWLHGCASSPSVIATPNVCPAKRDKPDKLMGPLPEQLPALAEALPKGYTAEQAADALQRNRRESAVAYSACVDSRIGLIEWIRSEP